jgi:hypothetical protein
MPVSVGFVVDKVTLAQVFFRILRIFLVIVLHHHHYHRLHGLGRLTCSGNDALPSFPRAYTISSSSRFVGEGVFREFGVVHPFKMVDPVLYVFESHVLYRCNNNSLLIIPIS